MAADHGQRGLEVQVFGVHQRAVEVEQQRGERTGKRAGHEGGGRRRALRSLAALVSIVALLPACSNIPREGQHPPRRVIDAGWLTIEWPERYAHWQPEVEWRLEQLEESLSFFLRDWPQESGPKPRLIVCRDPENAAQELAARGLRADPRVPRTFPALRLALVPLPLDDPLLAAQREAPLTWTWSLIHEAVHLFAAGRPGLAEAPLWFQEGLAEAFRDGFPTIFDHQARWPIPGERDLAAEDRLEAWAYWTIEGFQRRGAESPWRAIEGLGDEDAASTIRNSLYKSQHDEWNSPRRWRGREAEVDDERGSYFAAPLPDQIVEVDLPPLESGVAIEYELRTGTTGRPDSGLLIKCEDGAVVFLRCDSAGGLAAWAGRAGEAPRNQGTDRSADRARPGTPRAVRIEHRGDELVISADGGFLFRHALAESARDYPVEIVLYARGGVFAARRLP